MHRPILLTAFAVLCFLSVEAAAQNKTSPDGVAYDKDRKVTVLTENGSATYLCFDATAEDGDMLSLLSYPSATYIELSKTQISDDAASTLAAFTGIKTLHLAGTAIGDAALADLTALTQLEVLNLAGTKVTDAGLADLAAMTSLKELRLSGTAVTDAGLEQLKSLENLQSLWVQDTHVTPDAVHRLEDALRKTRTLANGISVTSTVNIKYSTPAPSGSAPVEAADATEEPGTSD
jgi:hypothetical protein